MAPDIVLASMTTSKSGDNTILSILFYSILFSLYQGRVSCDPLDGMIQIPLL